MALATKNALSENKEAKFAEVDDKEKKDDKEKTDDTEAKDDTGKKDDKDSDDKEGYKASDESTLSNTAEFTTIATVTVTDVNADIGTITVADTYTIVGTDTVETDGKYAELNTNFNALQAKFDLLFEENKALKTKIEAKELYEKQILIDAVFAKFASMLSEEDIKDIKVKAIEMEVSEIENKLYSIYGMKMAKFSKKPSNGLIELGIIQDIKTDTTQEISDVFIKTKNEINK